MEEIAVFQSCRYLRQFIECRFTCSPCCGLVSCRRVLYIHVHCVMLEGFVYSGSLSHDGEFCSMFVFIHNSDAVLGNAGMCF